MDSKPNGDDKTRDLLEKARSGDRTAREDLIAAHRGFIASCVLRAVPVRGEVTETDEYSVALLAFNEAVDRYDAARGASFHGFARQVIRRRLVDHYRSARRHAPEVPCAELPPEAEQPPAELPADEVREEIERLAAALAAYGISFADLVHDTPKHQDSRRLAVGIARRILADPRLRTDLERKKRIPVKILLKQLMYSPKTVQRHRRYIIAACLILGGDYPLLQEYVRGVEEGGE